MGKSPKRNQREDDEQELRNVREQKRADDAKAEVEELRRRLQLAESQSAHLASVAEGNANAWDHERVLKG